MKGRHSKGAASTDLLVCFPTRAHLRLMPKPICSPASPTESSTKRLRRRHHHHHHHHQPSPLLWTKTKPVGSEGAEPASPKVTCAGQIKVGQKPSSFKNWHSVMQRIERIHNNRKHKKRPAWVEALGFKKDVMQFLTCLRGIRFDFRCFGSVPAADISSDDDHDVDGHYDEDQEDPEDQVGTEGRDRFGSSFADFSKWSTVLQENRKNVFGKELEEKDGSCDGGSVAPPPPNALLLMRSRSAPAKSWLEEEEANKEKLVLEEEKKKKETLVVSSYAADYLGFSSEIAKETWVFGGMRDPLTRSRSWKR